MRFGPGSTRHPLAIRSLLAVLTLIGLASASAVAKDVTWTFGPIEVPGAPFTAARAISADGRIVGFYGAVNGPQHGFLLADGIFTTIDVPVPGARWTQVFGINARGDIVGAFADEDLVQHGFLWRAHGAFTVIDGPSSTDDGPTIRTLAKGINAAGDITGYYDTVNKRHGFLLSRRDVFTTIDLEGTQGPPPNGTFVQWINGRRDIVGSFFDGSVHGFLMSGDTVTQLDVPFPGAVNTNAPGLNNRGDIVGFYTDTVTRRVLGFRRDRTGHYESFEAPTETPSSSTIPTGINNRGDIVGQYTHAGVTRGFVLYRARTPQR
jgi:probable HAF family extracellular repeat protein